MIHRIPGQARRFGALAQLPLQSLSAGRNILINGDFVVDRRRGDNSAYTSATSPVNSDDKFLLDRWILLSDGNDIADVNQEAVGTSSDIPADGRGAIKLDVETANKKFGIFQPIENANCKHIDGQVVSLSFKVKAGGGSSISNIRAGIVQLGTGSEDSFVSDIVSAWEAAGTDPSLNVGWSYANTPANIALTTSYQTVKVEGVTMGALGNAGVFIWVDDTDPIAGEFVFIADVQLEVGPTATNYDRRSIQDEQLLCERYFAKTFSSGTIPADNAGTVGALYALGYDLTNFDFTWDFQVEMRATPTTVTFNPGSGTSGESRNVTDSTDEAVTTLFAGSNRVAFKNTAVVAGNTGDNMVLHATAEAEL